MCCRTLLWTATAGPSSFDPSRLQEDTKASLAAAEILITEPFVIAKLLEHDPSGLSSLRWCQSTYAGVDPIFNARISLPRDWILTRFAGCFGPPIAEWALANMIAHERSFSAVAILGCGDIGMCVAKAAKAFGMTTRGYGRTERSAVDDCIDFYTTKLEEALCGADYIVSVLPSTPETRGLLNGDALRACSGKPVVLLNAGRGDLISEDSIIKALDQRYLQAAYLDVFEVEPLPAESSLWEREDVVISPHVSALTQPSDVPAVFIENYERFIMGRELKYVVDWSKGY
ncbi:hypothetical protein THAOC_28069 [Thalassiosira oceanica]|uniref:D-isomer specific 2-hydroxyacid dehydrogenase NAD-binding domain-containing protein n=1 Tax=Thalassiosira oceanica TaxID=159749 RepID=K0RK58_THAOC|nr:hypothetical protein THAOC_28069 [Thalassiosira oceanica]|eukprot:EJK52644.1 hypothetical protein THAOC_28069 [Thalassiosira oceanica]